MTLRIAFEFFKELCSHVLLEVIIVDKDLTEIAVLQQVFRAARILLRNFRVIKYMKNIIATALVTVELEETIMSKSKAAMYSLTEDTFEKNKDDFLLVADGAQVRVNKKYFTCLCLSALSLIHI